MARKVSGRKILAGIRFLFSLAVVALFFYAYFSPAITTNGILGALVNAQFSAVLYGGIGLVVIVILAITLLGGRLYCSVLCPLGTMQELVWRIAKRLRRGKSPPRSSPASGSSATPSPGGAKHPQAPSFFRTGYYAPLKARYAVPLLVAIGVIFSIAPLMVIFDPISTFGRGMSAFRSLFLRGGAVAFVFAAPLLFIVIFAVFRGRAFCSCCPVGITLGLFSSAAPFGIKVSPKCVSCGLCEKNCPMHCIDSKAKRIDSERCVLCFSCTAVCPTGNVAYGVRGAAAVSGEARRVFLKGASKASLACGAAYLFGPSLKLFSRPADATLATLSEGETLPILPPGAKNEIHYTSRCIMCHACVASCPANIITAKDDPHPRLDYNGDATAACQFNCIECSSVCPTGAISRLSVDEKHRTRIALSTLYFERCVVKTKHESCGACAEVCPTGALTMVAYSEPGIPFLTMPIYDERYCIGCGACLAACPAEPRAFTLAAVSEQSLTVGSRPLEESGDELQVDRATTDDFPF
ncbi:MAG: 4Fe-4S binding protein [Treponemataceae bacterium]|nr:MAG: 4Fe-4S binding protein [Treponemataceae bacterium]